MLLNCCNGFYITTLSAARTIKRRVIRWLIDNELEKMWKETAARRYYTGICLEELRKTMRSLIQTSQSPGPGLIEECQPLGCELRRLGHSLYNTEVIFIFPTFWPIVLIKLSLSTTKACQEAIGRYIDGPIGHISIDRSTDRTMYRSIGRRTARYIDR
jgi:hypothetical protein